MAEHKHPVTSTAKKLADFIFSILTAFLALCVLIMLSMVFINVVMRYAFNSGIDISTEVARLSFVWLTFAGAVLAFRGREHLAINMVVNRLPIRAQKATHIVRQLLILWVLWLAIKGGWEQTIIGMSTVTPVSGMPIAVFSGAVLFSSAAMALMAALDLFAALLTPAVPENSQVFRTSVDSIEEI
ncbi:MAG TPA: TRAP transporter small permease [Castellaniella sp.]|uniref:TRAP transporter small permease n=1 Tax=Castellaniella sp. TaxID=1955812 RepID=UPI002EDC4099